MKEMDMAYTPEMLSLAHDLVQLQVTASDKLREARKEVFDLVRRDTLFVVVAALLGCAVLFYVALLNWNQARTGSQLNPNVHYALVALACVAGLANLRLAWTWLERLYLCWLALKESTAQAAHWRGLSAEQELANALDAASAVIDKAKHQPT